MLIILSPHAHYKLLQKMNQQQTAGERVKTEYHQHDGDQRPLDPVSLSPPDLPSFSVVGNILLCSFLPSYPPLFLLHELTMCAMECLSILGTSL